jgi:TolB protein
MSKRTVLAGLLVAAATVGGVATMAHATPPGRNGLIAFSRYRFVNSPLRREIWVQNLDGSALRRLTTVPANYVDSSPSWAPDGSRLVFTRCAPDPNNGNIGDGRCSIWTVRADGSGQRALSRACPAKVGIASCPDDDGAVFSPDGRRLVFNRGPYSIGGVVVSDAQLRHARAFPAPPTMPDLGAFSWSPDGRRIAFEARSNSNSAIFVVNADGSGRHRLTPWRLEAYGGDRIDWSPDGTRILFHSITSDYQGAIPRDGDLYTIRPDGTDLRRLTHLPPGTGIQLGSYSPDGQWIVFSTSAGATPGPTNDRLWPDVFVIKTDGTGLTPVTRTKNWEGSPDWGPSQ